MIANELNFTIFILARANHNNYLVVVEAAIASKLEKKNDSIFSSFNPFPSLPSVATDDRKQFQCHNIVFNNKTTPLFLESN